MRILLVEDDLAVSQQISNELESEGLNCDVVTSTADALSALRTTPYSVAILDHYLEHETTLFLSSHLRLRHAETKIITITGSALFANGYGLDRLCTDFLFRKPVPMRDLIEVVKYLKDTTDYTEISVSGPTQSLAI